MRDFALTVVLTAIGATTWLGADRLGRIGDRIEELEVRVGVGEAAGAQLAELERRCSELEGALEDQRAELSADRAAVREAERRDRERVRELSAALLAARRELALLDSALGDQAGRLEGLASASAGARALEARFDVLGAELRGSFQGLAELATSAADQAGANRLQLDRLGTSLGHRLETALAERRDLAAMWGGLVGPVVQLAGDSSVGSGVLLESRLRPGNGGYTTYLVTAWHVVRDIQGSLDRRDEPVPVTIYAEDGGLEHESAELLRHDADLDVALLRVRSRRPFPHGARLAPRVRVEAVRTFDRIYAVGCPLGNDPIPTAGEVASTCHEVDGTTYWMINAPTFIGNSGGGIFDAETHELLGIFSKIYNYGSLRPTIVPHMGLVTPLDRVYDWLEGVGYAALEPGAPDEATRVASAREPGGGR